MRLPVLNAIKQTTDGVTSFTGYDHRLKTNANAFHDMMNMSSEWLPVMSTRRKRWYLRTLDKPNGLFAHDKLCWVDGTDFFYGGERKGTVKDSPKQMVRMGAYVLIWPDKAYYNTAKDEFGYLERTNRTAKAVSAVLCTLDGIQYEYEASETAPAKPENGQYWMDIGSTPNLLKMWNETDGAWVSVPTVYTKLTSEGIGIGFSDNDGVDISGFYDHTELNNSYCLVKANDNSIVITALIPEAFLQTQPLTITRKIPDMDFVTENGNRIWGCSNARHEIYASSLGDPKNWNQFLGLASDSYAVTVGTAGEFTGAKSHYGNVLFFKENSIHTIMGTKPANFQLDTTECRGVMKGCHKSIVSVNETLLFKNRFDVCRFGSSLPGAVSDVLGGVSYQNAVAGAVDGRYYICMQDQDGCPHVFVYDTTTGAWVKEDHADVMDYATLDGQLYMLLSNGKMWCVTGAGAAEYYGADAHEEGEGSTVVAPEWMLETGDIGLDEPYSHHISGIQIHAECELGTTVTMEIRCDADTIWERVLTCAPVTRRSLTIPYVPRRCRTLRIRLSGNGGFKLFSIVKKTEVGSDVYGTV